MKNTQRSPRRNAEGRDAELRRLLERRKREVLGQVQTTMRDVSADRRIESLDVRDDAEQSDVELRSNVDLALLEIRSEMAARIDEALVHLAEGRYGSCVACGRDIPLARLTAQPFATRCTACEQAHEDDRQRAAEARRTSERVLSLWGAA